MLAFNASTLILIAKVELLDPFLAGMGLEVVIPREVERECCAGKKTLDSVVIEKALQESRIKVIAAKNRKLVATLREDFTLGKGEAEAIALAFEKRARVVGIDDKNGINACKLLGLAFTTAVNILVRSHEKGLVDQSGALAKLARLARWGRYKTSIVEDARLKLERRQ